MSHNQKSDPAVLVEALTEIAEIKPIEMESGSPMRGPVYEGDWSILQRAREIAKFALAAYQPAKEEAHMHTVTDLPRRVRLELQTSAEKAIRAAIIAVEALPADVRLTSAVILLGQARNKVSDYVDGIEPAKGDPVGETICRLNSAHEHVDATPAPQSSGAENACEQEEGA